MSSERSSLIPQAQRLTSALESSQESRELKREHDPLIEFRSGILGFFKGQMDSINELESFRREIRESMRADLSANVLNFEQKERMHNMLGSDLRQKAEPIMKLFQGVPGAPGPFNDLMKERDPEQIDKNRLANEMSSEKLQSLDNMMKILELITERLEIPIPAAIPETVEQPVAAEDSFEESLAPVDDEEDDFEDDEEVVDEDEALED